MQEEPVDRRLVREKIESRKLTCAVVGLGYVGFPFFWKWPTLGSMLLA